MGLKPFIDTWRAITGAERGKRKFNPVVSMGINRGIEIAVESLPQTFFQMIRMVLSVASNDAISTMQYFTVISSFAAIGFILAIMDYEVDTSESLRRVEPKVYGWIPTPKSKRVLLFVLSMLHTSAYAAMRVTVGVVLMYVHPIVFAAWMLTLFFAFTLIKLSRKTYTFFQRGPGFVSHLFHLLIFIGLYVGGCFTLRNPYYTISGRVYTYFLLFGYVDAFGMLFAAKFISSLTPETNIDFFDTYLHITIACACVSLPFLWIIKNRLMVQTYNWMWWSTDTPREHFSNWIWDNNVYVDFGPDMDDHRAHALSLFRREYYKHDLRVKDWLDSKWCEWEGSSCMVRRRLHSVASP